VQDVTEERPGFSHTQEQQHQQVPQEPELGELAQPLVQDPHKQQDKDPQLQQERQDPEQQVNLEKQVQAQAPQEHTLPQQQDLQVPDPHNQGLQQQLQAVDDQQHHEDAIIVDPNPAHTPANWHQPEEITFVSDVNLAGGEEGMSEAEMSVAEMSDPLSQTIDIDDEPEVMSPIRETNPDSANESFEVGDVKGSAKVVEQPPCIAAKSLEILTKFEETVDIDHDDEEDRAANEAEVNETGHVRPNETSKIDLDPTDETSQVNLNLTEVNETSQVGALRDNSQNSSAIAIAANSVRAIAAESFEKNGDVANDASSTSEMMIRCFRCQFKTDDRQGMLEHLCTEHFRYAGSYSCVFLSVKKMFSLHFSSSYAQLNTSVFIFQTRAAAQPAFVKQVRFVRRRVARPRVAPGARRRLPRHRLGVPSRRMK
jgi:hypothetical protein